MNNTINPTLSTPQILNLIDKVNMINVAKLPSNIKVGDVILLESLMNSDNSLFSLSLLTDNQKLPLQTQGALPAKLAENNMQQFSAKVVSQNTLQLIVKEYSKPLRDLAIINETNINLPQTKLQSISGQQIVAKAMNELSLPQKTQDKIQKMLPDSSVSTKIENIVVRDVAAQPILEPLKTAIKNLESSLLTNNQNQVDATQKQVVAELKNLTTQKFVATINTSSQLESPLGRIMMDDVLKLLPETKLELLINEVKTESPLPLQVLDKIFAQLEAVDIFPKVDYQKLLGQLQKRDEAVINLLKVFEPLQNSPQQILPILQKFPSFNNSILSNMHSFYKGATGQDVNVWLGTEVSQTLQNIGANGQAVLQNLQDFMGNIVKENMVWRIVEIPFFDGSQFIPFKMAVKKDNEEKKTSLNKKENGVRFMIETNFSKLGAFQIDGFSVVKSRRLDLIIRTTKTQSADFCSHIINLFKTSLYNVDYIGNIIINQKETFVKIESEAKANLVEGVFI